MKDLEDAKGFVTTFGSELHVDDKPASEDSILVKRMRDQGCVILGKTNTPEFGHKGKTDNVPFGITKTLGILNIHQEDLQEEHLQH